MKFIHPDWPAPETIQALCTTRIGGKSTGVFNSFNLATHVGDSPESVNSNRALLKRDLNLLSEPCWLNQTHSTQVTTLSRAWPYEVDADAAICRETNMVAVVLTADCLPILICNQQGDEVAALHAGWRGLADGIVKATLGKIQTPAAHLMAWVGPAISQARFEVGDEVRNIFVKNHREAEHRFKQNRPGHWLCDLPGLAVDQLRQLGILSVYKSGLCSYDSDSQFYSYRRENTTGRMASLIWINSGA